MNDLISRSELLARYDRIHVGAPGAARKLIEEAPAVDAVPVGKLEIEKLTVNTATNEAVVLISAGKEKILLKKQGRVRKSGKLAFSGRGGEV